MPRYTPQPQQPSTPRGGTLPKSVQFYLDVGAEQGGRNRALFAATCQLRDIGATPADAEGILLARAMRDGLAEREAKTTIASAFRAQPREAPTGSTGASFTPRPATPQPEKKKAAEALPAARPVPLPEPLAEGFTAILEAAFHKGEYVSIAPTREHEDGTTTPEKGVTLTREQWMDKAHRRGGIGKVFSTKQGLFMRVNPMRKGGSTNDEVTAFRHVLVEFDKDDSGTNIPKEKQLGVILSSGLPITAILDSGNKSVHAWVRVDAANAEEYKERVEIVYALFEGHHLDAANKNAARLSRCPGGVRTVQGEERTQTLLALNKGAASWQEWERQRKAVQFGEGIDFETLLNYPIANDPNCVLGNRWLCRGGSWVVVSQSGVGKSSLQMQLSMGWALNEPDMCFGIAGKKPLRSLILQAENDEGDLAEVAQGVSDAFGIRQNPQARAMLQANLRWHRITTLNGDAFCDALEDLCLLHRPDVCWIDPIISFIGGDISKQEIVSHFCYERLSSISIRTGVIFALIHHTAKPPKDKTLADQYTASDFAYAGLGSSALTNWAREVSYLNRINMPEGSTPTFSFTMCKRRKRAGLTVHGGSIVTEQIFIRHSGDGRIMWEQCEQPPEPVRGRRKKAAAPASNEGEALAPKAEPVAKKTGGRPSALTPEAKADVVKAIDLFGGKLDRQQRETLAEKWGVNPSTIFRFAQSVSEPEQHEHEQNDGIPNTPNT